MTTRRPPRVAITVLNRFAAGPEADGMAGDALERFAVDRSRVRLWRHIASIAVAQTAQGVRRDKAATIGAVIAGWLAYWLSTMPALAMMRATRRAISNWLISTDRYTQTWLFWSSLAAQTIIAYAFCIAIGWTVARLSRRIDLTGVTLFALSVLILEGGTVAFWLTTAIATGRTDVTVDAFAPAALFLGRVACIMLGGLLGRKTAEPQLAA